jgi:hypothetical protein
MSRGDNWAHQDSEFKKHRSDRARALFWTMRTGKTKAVLDKACFQFKKLNIKGLIVLAPNGVHVNWVVNELPRWVWDDVGEWQGFAWEMPKRGDPAWASSFERFLQPGGFRVLSVNMESIKYPDTIRAIRQFIASCGGEFMLAISEAHHFGRGGAKRTRLARNLGRAARFVTIESGTPILNSPLKAYALFKILDDDGLIPAGLREKAEERRRKGFEEALTYEDWVQHFAVIGIDKSQPASRRRRAYKKITSYKNLDELRELIAPFSSVVTRDQLEGMPELLNIERPVIMNEVQRKAYLEMVNRHLLEIGDDLVTSEEAGARMVKLQQILSGYIVESATKKVIEISKPADTPIYHALLEEIRGTLPERCIVWCRFREDIRRVVSFLNDCGQRTLEFHGGVPNSKREAIRRTFNESNVPYTLVGQPAAGGEGRDFSRAHAIIYFSSTPNAIHYEQSKERGTKKDGHSVAIVRLRTYGTVDDRNWALCDGKIVLADSVTGHGLKELLLKTDV